MLQEFSGKEVFITGAGGFIGSAVVGALLGRGAQIRGLLGAPDDEVRDLPGEVHVKRGEITDKSMICDLMAGADVVIHLAGPPSVAASFESAAEYARVHVTGTATVLEAYRRTRPRRLVYISSAEVYGCPQMNPVREDHPLRARSPYAAAKIAAEKFIESFVHAFTIEAVILRPFSIYGPGLSPQSLIGTILRQAREGDFVRLASLKPVRDYCYIKDLAEAIVRACTIKVSDSCPINIGTGEGASVARVANLILEILGREIPLLEDASAHRPGRSEINLLVADMRRSRDVLAWAPEYSLKSGLEEMIHLLRG